MRLLVEASVRHSNALGWSPAEYRDLGTWWVVRRHEIDYPTPGRADDELTCYTWAVAAAKASAKRRHVLVRRHDRVVIARALNAWALLDMASGRPRRIPPAMREAFDPAKWSDGTGHGGEP